MAELIALVILILSFLGMIQIISRKIPLLAALPEASVKEESLFLKLKKKIEEINPLKNFSYEIFLQKILMKIRILILKVENQTFNWLIKLREKIQTKKIIEKDSYWEKIKKEIKKKPA